MNRYYLPPNDWGSDLLTLTGDEAKHCARVMRAKVGDQLEVFNGEGTSAICQILSAENSQVALQIQSRNQTIKPSRRIVLCQAIPKGSNMELIVQKAVELGIQHIQPLITDHTVARPDQAAKKQKKWQRTALEACKQCGQNHLPSVNEPMAFTDWIRTQLRGDKIIAALHPEAKPLAEATASLAADSQPIHLLIGPEGDFSPAEYQAAMEAGFTPVTLGDIILRTETASLYCLSIIKYEIEKAATK